MNRVFEDGIMEIHIREWDVVFEVRVEFTTPDTHTVYNLMHREDEYWVWKDGQPTGSIMALWVLCRLEKTLKAGQMTEAMWETLHHLFTRLPSPRIPDRYMPLGHPQDPAREKPDPRDHLSPPKTDDASQQSA